MNIRRLALPCVMLAAAMVIRAQAPAAAPEAKPNKVGVIQIQSAIVSTRDGQKAVADLEAQMAPRKSDLDKKQAEIRDLQDRLQRGGNAMAEAAKEDLTRTIDQKTKSYNREMEDAQAEFQDDQRKLINDLGQRMMKVIDNYAQTHGFTVILDVSNPNTPVLYASNTVDITRDIIDLYDKLSPGPATTSQTGKPAAPASSAAAAKSASAPSGSPALPAARKQP